MAIHLRQLHHCYAGTGKTSEMQQEIHLFPFALNLAGHMPLILNLVEDAARFCEFVTLQ